MDRTLPPASGEHRREMKSGLYDGTLLSVWQLSHPSPSACLLMSTFTASLKPRVADSTRKATAALLDPADYHDLLRGVREPVLCPTLPASASGHPIVVRWRCYLSTAQLGACFELDRLPPGDPLLPALELEDPVVAGAL